MTDPTPFTTGDVVRLKGSTPDKHMLVADALTITEDGQLRYRIVCNFPGDHEDKKGLEEEIFDAEELELCDPHAETPWLGPNVLNMQFPPEDSLPAAGQGSLLLPPLALQPVPHLRPPAHLTPPLRPLLAENAHPSNPPPDLEDDETDIPGRLVAEE